jgi:hypothetical protein
VSPRDIYDKHDAAFKNVNAYVIHKDGERKATIAFKRSASGLRLTVFVHWFGLPMVTAFASGGGYDKASAAVASAMVKIAMLKRCSNLEEDRLAWEREYSQGLAEFIIIEDGGYSWDRYLRDAGFDVWQAV